MLEYDKIKGEVVPIDNIHLEDNPLNDLYKSARQKGKKFFWEAIKYAYHMYKKGSTYSNLFPNERGREVSKVYFGDRDYWKKFELNSKFEAFKKYYEGLQYDATERTLLKTNEDIENLLDHLGEIGFYIKKKVEVELTIPAFKDSEEMVKYIHIEIVDVSNFDEKKKALLAIKDIISIRKILKEEIKVRNMDKKNTAGKSLLDKGEI